MRVRWLSLNKIEAAAEKLIADYAKAYGPLAAPPVPVETILEAQLQLSLEILDLKGELGAADVLAAIYMQEKRVVVDESLDPTRIAAREGHYRFSLAHEIGHWELHRFQLMTDPRQMDLFAGPAKPTIACRSGSSKEPVEWQADRFAASLLMPEALLRDAWQKQNGGKLSVTHAEMRRVAAAFQSTEIEGVVGALVQPMAEMFKVSNQAMRIRLGSLGLIQTEDPGCDLLTE